MAGRRDELHERRTGYRGRRPLLADAAITILARDGSRGLTHRAVDREAHVPEGTTKNYYPTRHTILEAAAHRMAEHHRAALMKAQALWEDLVKLLRPASGEESDQAIYAVSRLKKIDPAVIQAMRSS